MRLTDNGTEYAIQYTDRCNREGTIHKTTPTYAAFSNGIVETSHKKAKYLLDILEEEHPKAAVDDILDTIQKTMNMEVKSNGRTPFEMALGRPIRVPDFEQTATLWEDSTEPFQVLREEMMLTAKKGLLAFYSDIQVKEALKQKLVRQNPGAEVGDRVWYYRMGKVNVRDGWFGPAVVLAKNGRLVIIKDGATCSILHDSRIRKYYPTPGQFKTPNETVDLSKLPPQQRGRHLVQNQGDLKLDVVHDVIPLETFEEELPA
jgi:hypothetical protein